MFNFYIIEIKNRLLLTFFSCFFSLSFCLIYKEILLYIFVKPCIIHENNYMYFIFTNVTEVFSAYLKLIIFINTQVFIFVMLFHLFMFLVPAFYGKEYKKIKSCFYFFFFIWFVFVNLFVRYVVSYTWNFFFEFQKTIDKQVVNFYLEAKTLDYLDFFISNYYVCVICCQFFVVYFFFFNVTKSNIKKLKKYKKKIIFLFFFFSTVITPPDVISQVVLGLCFLFFFETLVIYIIIKKNFFCFPK